jgi:hypothetical protein
MSDSKKLVLAKQLQNKIDLNEQENGLVESGYIFGGIHVMNQLVTALSAQVMYALQRAQESKEHEKLGFKSFDEMLDHWDRSPMKSSKYYRLRKQLEEEGPQFFDLMSTLKVPASTRKLLKGQMRIEDDELVIGNDRLPLTETTRLKAVLKHIALEQEKAANKQTALEKEVKDLKNKLVETVKAASKRNGDAKQNTPHEQAFALALLALNELIKEAEALEGAEKEQVRGNVLNKLGEFTVRLNEAYGITAKPAKAEPKDKVAALVAEANEELFNDD